MKLKELIKNTLFTTDQGWTDFGDTEMNDCKNGYYQSYCNHSNSYFVQYWADKKELRISDNTGVCDPLDFYGIDKQYYVSKMGWLTGSAYLYSDMSLLNIVGSAELTDYGWIDNNGQLVLVEMS